MLISSRPDHVLPRFFAGAAALLLALLLASLATPAHAHSVLLGTDPEDEEQLAAAPDAVSLTFNEDITELGTEVVVTTDAGETVSEGDIQVNGPVITQALTDVRPAGAYTVTWRAVSADGHPISGEFTFTAAQAVGEEDAAEAAQEPEETDPGTEQGEEEADEPEPSQTEDDPAEASDGLSASTWVIIGVLVVAAIILVTVLARSMGASKREE